MVSPLALCALIAAAPQVFDVRGQFTPAARAAVMLHGTSTPFQVSGLSDSDGRFRFKNIPAGTYTVSVFIPGRGENRLSIDVGPSTADAKGRLAVVFRLDESKTTPDRSSLVSVKQLSVPDSARREAENAQKKLAQNDVPGAIAALQRAVKIAPQFAQAWNHLGTIAYQTKNYKDAEQYFRKSLEADPDAFEPLVNLGGVLLTLEQAADAWSYNVNAVLKRPNDALANSQLGMNYLAFGRLDLAEKYLKEARRLDPGHFSHPQILLAEIAFRKGNYKAAADQLEDFLRFHPDAPNADDIRKRITELRSRQKPAAPPIPRATAL